AREGVCDARYGRGAAVKFPYLDESGAVLAERYRIAMAGPDRFRWHKGDTACLYGLWRLESYPDGCAVHLVEGESDSLALWLHGFPAVGVPGVDTWKDDWAVHLDRFGIVYAWIEPDGGGANFEARLRASPLARKLRLIRPGQEAV